MVSESAAGMLSIRVRNDMIAEDNNVYSRYWYPRPTHRRSNDKIVRSRAHRSLHIGVCANPNALIASGDTLVESTE